MNEVSKDGLFCITEVECLGACVNAPMLQINNEWVYEDLTEQNTIELIEKLRRGEEVKKGPQNHRKNSEGPNGRTTLIQTEQNKDSKTEFSRDLAKAKQDWQKAKEEAEKAAAEKLLAEKAKTEKK